MGSKFLTISDRERFSRFPEEITENDIITFFTLSELDLAQIPVYSAPYNRLGFALQLCALRYLGFSPEDLSTVPTDALEYLGKLLSVSPSELQEYGNRPQTKAEHLQKVMKYLSFRKATPIDLEIFNAWLLERALEHDRPSLLLQMACKKLHQEKIVRPGITVLERTIIAVRSESQREVYRRLSPVLTNDLKNAMDKIVAPDSSGERTMLFWLRKSASQNTPKSILKSIDKLNWLKSLGVHDWEILSINPNRLKLLAQLGRKYSKQSLFRASDERRYPILIALFYQSLVDLIDETIDIFDRYLAESYAKSERKLDEFKKSVDRSKNEKVWYLRDIGSRILNHDDIADGELRAAIYQYIARDKLQNNR